MSAENIHSVTVGIEADTPVEFVRGADSYPEAGNRAGFDRVNVGDATIWPGYRSNDDADVVTACDHLIDALQQVRAHALQRLAKEPAATLAADPDLLFAGTVGDFLAAQEGEATPYGRGAAGCEWAYADRADCADYRIRYRITRPCPAHGALPASEAAS